MNKAERLEAARLIRETIDLGERFELKLPCGMIVRCDNTLEARDSMARKFEKGYKHPRVHSHNILKRKLFK